MKSKLLLLALFVLFLTGQTSAQAFRGGITTGLTASEVNGATYSGHFHKVGLCLGLLVNRQISEKNVFQLELNFTQKGSYQRGDSLGNGRFVISMSYVEVPVLIRHKIHFMKRGKPVNRIDLEGGASFGRMVSHYSVDKQNTVLPPTVNYFNPNDVSLLVGFDINVSKNFIVCFRYSNSIIPAIKRNTPNLHFITYTFNRGNNEVMLFSLKFLFGGKAEEPTPVKPVDTEE